MAALRYVSFATLDRSCSTDADIVPSQSGIHYMVWIGRMNE